MNYTTRILLHFYNSVVKLIKAYILMRKLYLKKVIFSLTKHENVTTTHLEYLVESQDISVLYKLTKINITATVATIIKM